jgi:hypothetical protein
MYIPRVRLTIRGMMVVVALAGLTFAAFRVNPAIGVLVGSVSCLTLIRVLGVIGRANAGGTPLGRAGIVRCSLALAFIVASLLVVSMLPSLFIFPIINRARMHETPRLHADDVLWICVAALMGIPIASVFRRRLW